MTGLTPFSIEYSDNFKRSFKKLAKALGANFIERLTEVIENLTDDPYPITSRQEPLPGKIHLLPEWRFYKLELKISNYIYAAMNRAKYEILDDGIFYGEIPDCQGVWSSGKTLEQCRENLQDALEGWIILGLRLGHRLPILENIKI